jgi:predicted helicase
MRHIGLQAKAVLSRMPFLKKNIAIRKRLFFTATPRHYDIRHRNREGDFEIQAMDDPELYGPRAHTLTFGSAARQGIICNYKVVISVVDGQEVNDFTLKHGITLVEGGLMPSGLQIRLPLNAP